MSFAGFPDFPDTRKTGASRLSDHLARREVLWRKKTGGKTVSTCLSDGRKAGPQHERAFAADTAARTGVDKRTVNRALALGDDVQVALGGSQP